MAVFVECKKCRGLVANYAKQCPACGIEDPASLLKSSPPSATASSAANWIVALIFGAMIFGLYSCMTDSPEEKQQKAVVESQKAAEQAKKKAADKKAGFHCLSGWDGSHSGVVRQVKELLRDPNSFEHVSTKITPVNDTGAHTLFMTYRAKNGFGGMTGGVATATVRNAGCDATILTNQ